jgi:hypothetical protein
MNKNPSPNARAYATERQLLIVLDFAGAYLDRRPEFPPDVWADWEVEKREQFEDRWPMVQRVLDAFEQHDIDLLDVSAGNISFKL